MGKLCKLLLGISEGETTFHRRGFPVGNPEARRHLERAARCFVSGYHWALLDARLPALVENLNGVELEYRGFAYEGAAMGLALLDFLTPWSGRRLEQFLNGPGEAHAYMVHVGAGWALARVPASIERMKRRLEPLLCWLALDGYGFHEGFFKWRRYAAGGVPPKRVMGYGCRAFDQGLGRSLWFVSGAGVRSIPRLIEAFPEKRRSDLWSGVGLAAVYAGGIRAEALVELRESAGDYRAELAQGGAFAAKARHRAGNLTDYANAACEQVCGCSAEEAAKITDLTLENLSQDGEQPEYEIWRRRIQSHFRSDRAGTYERPGRSGGEDSQ